MLNGIASETIAKSWIKAKLKLNLAMIHDQKSDVL